MSEWVIFSFKKGYIDWVFNFPSEIERLFEKTAEIKLEAGRRASNRVDISENERK
jgi:hypothetical protein